MKYFAKTLILLTLFLQGCTQEKSEGPVTKTGVEMTASGGIHFGNVIINNYREAIIKITNHGPDIVSPFSPILNAPFSISSISAPCDNGVIPVNATCSVIVRFKPLAKASYTATLTVQDKVQEISGRGLDSAGIIDYSVSAWNLGSVVSGSSNLRDVELTNSGDFTVSTPTFAPLTGYSRTLNECGDFIAPQRTCKMRFTIVKQTIGSQVDELVFSSVDTASFIITVTSDVIAGPPSGTISIVNPPSSIIADNTDVKTISTAPIRDQFNNIVTDGTSVSLIVSNLNLIGPNTRTTVGGVVSFDVRATNQRGDATVTVISNSASGFARFRSIAGPAVGQITSKPFIDTVEANGVSQIDIRLNPLRDQFNNVVEDGTEVRYCIRTSPGQCVGNVGGSSTGGTLQFTTGNTVLGESQIIVIPPLSVGSAKVIVQAGGLNSATPCGWNACGEFPIYFTAGQGSGSIPVSSALAGIFADPSTGITSVPQEVIQTTINIGPVRDQNNNIVATNSPISINLTNAIGVSSSTSNFTINTNSSGMASFSIQGTGTRGYITIDASLDQATGTHQLWAYGNATLRPLGSSYPDNKFKVYMTYHSIASDPSAATTSWGLIKDWANIDIQDKNYFGDLKKQAPPTQIANNLPYFVSKCLFNSANTTYGSSCFENNYNDSSLSANTFRLTKANLSGDPGASRLDLLLNEFPRNQHHKQTVVGCYNNNNEDAPNNNPIGSTYGNLLYYNTTQARCSTDTSSDPSSPVYQNHFYKWFGGTWLTNYSFDLRLSSIGFIPNIGRSLIFGGFYENAMYGGGSQTPNHYETFLTNRHTWTGNFGIDQSFVWTESQNVENIFGDFPTASAMPSFTGEGNNLYMFGGLLLRGISHTQVGPTTNYIQSTSSDEFSIYDGIVNKWFRLSPSDDSTLPEDVEVKSPSGRYQHGMVVVPDNNKLFVASGKTVDLQLGFNWFNTNDMWSVDVSDRGGDLEWRRNCSPCGFPVDAHNHPAALTPSALNPTPLKMTYHPYLQKVFMLWSGTNNAISNFNPLASDLITVSNTNPYSFSSLQGSNLFDMEVNPDIGRTYFYKRNSVNLADSEMYYWDMDAGNKQFIKIETDLGGAPAKNFIRRLTVHVRGYGSIQDSSQAVQGVGGIVVKIYNQDTGAWELLGSNSAKIESEDVVAQSIVITYNQANANKYVSADGKVLTMITIRDTSNYIGTGYNELKLDEFYVDGLF